MPQMPAAKQAASGAGKDGKYPQTGAPSTTRSAVALNADGRRSAAQVAGAIVVGPAPRPAGMPARPPRGWANVSDYSMHIPLFRRRFQPRSSKELDSAPSQNGMFAPDWDPGSATGGGGGGTGAMPYGYMPPYSPYGMPGGVPMHHPHPWMVQQWPQAYGRYGPVLAV